MFDEAMSVFPARYNSSDKRARILAKWQTLRLTDKMGIDLKESGTGVFRAFIAELLSLTKKLDPSCPDERFLQYTMMTAVDMPSIEVSIRNRICQTAHPQTNRATDRLSSSLQSAGASVINYFSSDSERKRRRRTVLT